MIFGLTIAVGGVWLGATSAFERLASWAELSQGYYLWDEEEWLEVLNPARYANVRDGVLLTGASEAREALLVEDLAAAFPGGPIIENAQSLGNLQSVTLQLEYIRRVHGVEGFPRLVLLGVSPRVVFNDPGLSETPLLGAINRYSPYLSAELTADGFEWKDRPWAEGLLAKLRFAGKQSARYKNALRAGALEVATQFKPAVADLPVFRGRLDPYKYQHLEPFRDRDYWGEFRVAEPPPFDVSPEYTELVQSDARRLMGVMQEVGSQLVIVVLPEAPWIRATYRRGFHEEFIGLMAESYPGIPILDLTYELTADHYYDHNHVTRHGAKITTEGTIEFMKALKEVHP